LMRINNDLVMGQVAEGLAKRVLASSATPRQKLYADAHLVLLKIKPVGRASPTGAGPNGAGTQPVKAGPELVRRFVQRHGRGKLGAEAYGVAMQLAAELEDRALGEELKEVFVKEYPAHPDARRILREQGKGPDVGKPFKAELRKLDGSKLKLPEGLLGKVVVVDFWATWCGYCVAEIPRMKALHAKYEARGVEFVGVSLDSDPKAVDGFVRGQGMNWIHACSGLGWSDPTVRRYGIGGIPNIWVVGRDGKVVSDNARADLEATIRRALAAPATTTKPARK
jgi:thiol-disulfide isomerase/thioredoxin